MSEEESFFSDASQSDVGSIFSDGGSSCDKDSFGPSDEPPISKLFRSGPLETNHLI